MAMENDPGNRLDMMRVMETWRWYHGRSCDGRSLCEGYDPGDGLAKTRVMESLDVDLSEVGATAFMFPKLTAKSGGTATTSPT